MHFKRTAHLGALHVEGGQLPAVGLLLERRPEVKVHGSHTQVDSNLWERKFHDVQIQCSEKSGSKRWSFKEVTKDTGNWCERRSRWNMDEIAITISDEEHGNCFFFFFHLDCRFSPHRSQSWTIELTSLDSSWWDCYMEWFFCLKTSVFGVSFFLFYSNADEWYNWQWKITDTGNPSKTGRAGLKIWFQRHFVCFLLHSRWFDFSCACHCLFVCYSLPPDDCAFYCVLFVIIASKRLW